MQSVGRPSAVAGEAARRTACYLAQRLNPWLALGVMSGRPCSRQRLGGVPQGCVTWVAVLGAHTEPQRQSPALPSSWNPAAFTTPAGPTPALRTTTTSGTAGKCDGLLAVPSRNAER